MVATMVNRCLPGAPSSPVPTTFTVVSEITESQKSAGYNMAKANNRIGSNKKNTLIVTSSNERPSSAISSASSSASSSSSSGCSTASYSAARVPSRGRVLAADAHRRSSTAGVAIGRSHSHVTPASRQLRMVGASGGGAHGVNYSSSGSTRHDMLRRAASKTRRSYDMGDGGVDSASGNVGSGSSTPSGGVSDAIQLTLVLMGAPQVGKSTLVNQFLWEIFLPDYRPTVEEFNWVEYSFQRPPSGSACGPATSVGGEETTRRVVTAAPLRRRHYSSSNYGSAAASVESNESDGSCGGKTKPQQQSVLLQLIDSAGSRDFLAMRHLYYKIGDAFMVVFAANDAMSYAEALLMVGEIQQHNTKQAPILLVENKSDLISAYGSGGDSTSREDRKTQIFNDIASAAGQTPNRTDGQQSLDFVKISAKNLNHVQQAFGRLIDELARRRQLDCGSVGAGASVGAAVTAAVAHRSQLQRRRQSMPSRRTANELGIDAETLERLVRKHNVAAGVNSRVNCAIS